MGAVKRLWETLVERACRLCGEPADSTEEIPLCAACRRELIAEGELYDDEA